MVKPEDKKKIFNESESEDEEDVDNSDAFSYFSLRRFSNIMLPNIWNSDGPNQTPPNHSIHIPQPAVDKPFLNLTINFNSQESNCVIIGY